MFHPMDNRKSKIETMKKVTKLGSKWNNSANAGAFYWNLNNASSNRNRNISRQLVNVRNTPPFAGRGVLYICIPGHRATWQNNPFMGQPVGRWKNKQACIGRF